MILIGNIVMFVGAVLMALSGFLKNKKSILIVQTIQIAIMGIGCFLLGSIPGAIINVFSIFRNILAYKKKLTKPAIGFILIASFAISVLTNNMGIYGFIPAIASVLYLLFLNTENIILFKAMLITTAAMWCVHDVCINAYVTVIFDFINIVACIYSVCAILKQKKNAKLACAMI